MDNTKDRTTNKDFVESITTHRGRQLIKIYSSVAHGHGNSSMPGSFESVAKPRTMYSAAYYT